MNHSAKLHALAATSRLANIPSVLGNVWLGIALAAASGHWPTGGPWVGRAAALGTAATCLYLAGNFLNDWADRDWDAARRPERALPRALFPAGFYLSVALACGALGLAAAAAVHRRCLAVALLIGLGIVLYTWFHKRSAWAVIAMGGCRALLPVLGFAGFARPAGLLATPGQSAAAVLTACAFGLFCHIAGLSLSARSESMARPPVGALRLARAIFAAAAVSMFLAAWLLLSLPLRFCVLGLLPYGLWVGLCLTFLRHPVSRQVASLLAGIPLVDFIVLLPLALTLGAAPWWSPPLATLCLLVPPVAVGAGWLLQRLAPAT